MLCRELSVKSLRDDKESLFDCREHTDWGGSADILSQLSLSQKMYSETLLPGKGCGVVAVRDISPGELIIAETPLLLLPWWVRHSFFPGTHFSACLCSVSL